MTLVPFADANDIGDRFLALLQKLGLDRPPPASKLEDELLSLTQLIEVTRNPALATGPHRVSILRAAGGMHDLAAKVLSIETIPEFPRFLPHLKLINETKVQTSSIGQNAAGSVFDDVSRKMAELYIACLAAHTGFGVELDHPTHSKGDNPDVIFAVRDKSRQVSERWALAIKTISSKQGQTIFDNIKKGAEQIDDPKCKADRGFVIINTKDALDHNALWNPPTPFPDVSAATRALCAQLESLSNAAALNRPQQDWDQLFKGRARRPVLFLGQSLVRLPTPASSSTPTELKVMQMYPAGGAIDQTSHKIAYYLNHYMQIVLKGIPGSSGSEPQ